MQTRRRLHTDVKRLPRLNMIDSTCPDSRYCSYFAVVYVHFASRSVIARRAHASVRVIPIDASAAVQTRIRATFVHIDSTIFAYKTAEWVIHAFSEKNVSGSPFLVTVVPVKPGGHLHMNLFCPLMQDAPFKQGPGRHSSTSTSQ